mgnify:CR=1 FL=1
MYLIGSSYPAIIKLDVSKMKAEYIKEPFIEKVKKMGELKDAFFRTHHAVRGEWLYLASCVDNTVLKFNLKTNEYKWLSIGSDDNKFSGIVYSLNDFWLSPRTTEKIIKWDGMNVNIYSLYFDVENNVLRPNLDYDIQKDYSLFATEYDWWTYCRVFCSKSSLLNIAFRTRFFTNDFGERINWIQRNLFRIIRKVMIRMGIHNPY